MKFYLSSYRLGEKASELPKLMPAGKKKIAVIANAKDHLNEPDRRAEREMREMRDLRTLGLDPVLLDLREFFGWADLLKKKLAEFGGVWVLGGNTFVLRQAMWLSGFDLAVQDLYKTKADFLYAGYSAGVCVLAPTLRGLDIVDDATVKAYGDYATLWDGVGILEYSVAPHYQSDHPESADVDKEVAYLQQNNVPFKTLRDGEVLVIE